MSVRRLLMLLLLVGSLLALPVPASAGPRTDAAFVRATNADRREAGLRSMATSATLAKLARSHSIAMARKSARHYRGACTGRALWDNDISRPAAIAATSDHARLEVAARYPLTGRRWRWHHRRALSWAASSVGRAPGF